MPNVPGAYFREPDVIRSHGLGIALDQFVSQESARADVLQLLAERDAARKSCFQWQATAERQTNELRRAERFRKGTVAIGITLAFALLALGLAALLRWV